MGAGRPWALLAGVLRVLKSLCHQPVLCLSLWPRKLLSFSGLWCILWRVGSVRRRNLAHFVQFVWLFGGLAQLLLLPLLLPPCCKWSLDTCMPLAFFFIRHLINQKWYLFDLVKSSNERITQVEVRRRGLSLVNHKVCLSGTVTTPRGTGILRRAQPAQVQGTGTEAMLHQFIISHPHLVAKRLRLDSYANFCLFQGLVFIPLSPKCSGRVHVCCAASGITLAFMPTWNLFPWRKPLLLRANWHLNWLTCVASWTPWLCTQIKFKYCSFCPGREALVPKIKNNLILLSPTVAYTLAHRGGIL